MEIAAKGALGEPIIVAETSNSRGSGFPQMAKQGDKIHFAWTHLDEENNSTISTAVLNI